MTYNIEVKNNFLKITFHYNLLPSLVKVCPTLVFFAWVVWEINLKNIDIIEFILLFTIFSYLIYLPLSDYIYFKGRIINIEKKEEMLIINNKHLLEKGNVFVSLALIRGKYIQGYSVFLQNPKNTITMVKYLAKNEALDIKTELEKFVSS